MYKCFSHPEAAILKFVLSIRAHATFSPRQKKMSCDFEKGLLGRVKDLETRLLPFVMRGTRAHQ